MSDIFHDGKYIPAREALGLLRGELRRSLAYGVQDLGSTSEPYKCLLKGIQVECFGSLHEISHAARVELREPGLLELATHVHGLGFDVQNVLHALLRSELGSLATRAGDLIHVRLPRLSEPQRLQLIARLSELRDHAGQQARKVATALFAPLFGNDDLDEATQTELRAEIEQLLADTEQQLAGVFEERRAEIGKL